MLFQSRNQELEENIIRVYIYQYKQKDMQLAKIADAVIIKENMELQVERHITYLFRHIFYKDTFSEQEKKYLIYILSKESLK